MRFIDDGVDQAPVVEDAPNQRVIHTRYGFDIKLERRDPYGFVHVVWHKGAVPEPISGAYSDFNLARQAVTNYLDSTGFNQVVEEKPVFEKAEVKKRFRKEADGP
jgi:hypothetical protein